MSVHTAPEDAPHRCSQLAENSHVPKPPEQGHMQTAMVPACADPCQPQKGSERVSLWSRAKPVPGTAPENEHHRSSISTPARGPCSWGSPGNGTARVLGRDHWNPPSTGCELRCCGVPPFWAQNKMVLAWAALRFPLQNSNDLAMQRSHQDALILITEEANDWFWEYFTGKILFSLLCVKFFSCNNLILTVCVRKKSAFHGESALWLQIYPPPLKCAQGSKIACVFTYTYLHIYNMCMFKIYNM